MPINLHNITDRQKLIIAKGLLDYQFIMCNYQTNSQDFQDVYYDFYLKARWAVMKKTQNSNKYFDILQKTNSSAKLMDVIKDLKAKITTQSCEFSLCSKLLHTVNPNSPIYDSKVREYLSKNEKVEFWWSRSKGMYGKSARRGTTELQKIEHDWDELCKWYKNFLASQAGKDCIDWFDKNFPPYSSISPVKKLIV